MGINDANFARMGVDVLTQFGDSATYVPVTGESVSCMVHLDTDIAAAPDDYVTQARGAELTIEGLIAQIGNDISIRRAAGGGYVSGDKFVIGSDTYEVTEVLEEDAIYIKCAVRKM